MPDTDWAHIVPPRNEPASVIAEIGANHDGDIQKAHQMVDEVASTGATLVKFQLYTAEELVADTERTVTWGPPGRRHEETLCDLFDRLAVPVEAMRDLFSHSREAGLLPFASPFSERGVDTLLEIGAPVLKLAASEVTHIPLLRHAARSGAPIILSLGKCTLAEADEAVRCLEENGCRELSLLHCVATYPSPMDEMNLRTIPMLQSAFPDYPVGFSDHSLGLTAAIAAATLGARVIEKHVTRSRVDVGPDHWFSMEMDELAALVRATRDVSLALGDSRKRVVPSEEVGRERAIRSIYAARDLEAGSVLREEDVRIRRPGGGLPPATIDVLTGMELRHDVRASEQLAWDHFRPKQ